MFGTLSAIRMYRRQTQRQTMKQQFLWRCSVMSVGRYVVKIALEVAHKRLISPLE